MRRLLIIPMTIFEVILGCIVVVMLFIHLSTAKKIVDFVCNKFPNKEWYYR